MYPGRARTDAATALDGAGALRPPGDIAYPSPRAERRAALAGWRYLDATLLGLLVVSITAVNLVWVSLDSGRLYWDFARHLGGSVLYHDLFSLSDPLAVFEEYARYPPLVYWVTDAFYAFLGTELWVAILSNVVFLGILVYATYGIGTTLWSRRVGLLSAFFVVTSPLFVTHFKEYMLDAPLSSLVALSLYFLIRSEHFADRRFSLGLGLAAGLGLLVKWTLPFFLLLPAAFSAGVAVTRSVRERSATRLINLAGAAVLAVAVAAVWYGPHYREFRDEVDYSTSLPGSVQDSPPVDSLASVLWYFWNLVNNQLYLIPFLFFVAGVMYIVRRDEAATKNAPLILCIVGSYIALTLIELKDFRYTMPMMAAVAVIGTSWLEYVRPRLRNWLIAGLIVYGVAAFLVISFGTSLLPRDVTIEIKPRSYTSNLFHLAPPESIRVTGIVLFAQHGFIVGQPSDEEWHKEDVFKEIAARGESRTFWYSAGAETIWFTTWDTWYYSLRYDSIWVGTPQEAEFLIVRADTPADVTGGFALVRQYALPYRGPLSLYQRL